MDEKSAAALQRILAPYKGQEGRLVRWACTVTVWLLLAYGGYEMYRYLRPSSRVRIYADQGGTVRFADVRLGRDLEGRSIVENDDAVIQIADASGEVVESHSLPKGSRVEVQEGASVSAGDPLAEAPRQPIWQGEILGRQFPIYGWTLVCAGTVLIACTAAWWVMNRPKVAEFLIQTQGELRRIAWPSRREYQAASVAVIALVLFLGLFVFVVDEGLSWLFQKLGIGI